MALSRDRGRWGCSPTCPTRPIPQRVPQQTPTNRVLVPTTSPNAFGTCWGKHQPLTVGEPPRRPVWAPPAAPGAPATRPRRGRPPVGSGSSQAQGGGAGGRGGGGGGGRAANGQAAGTPPSRPRRAADASTWAAWGARAWQAVDGVGRWRSAGAERRPWTVGYSLGRRGQGPPVGDPLWDF